MALTAQEYHNCQRTKHPGTAQAKIEEISIFQAAQLGFSHLWPTAITCEASKGGCPRAERAIHSAVLKCQGTTCAVLKCQGTRQQPASWRPRNCRYAQCPGGMPGSN